MGFGAVDDYYAAGHGKHFCASGVSNSWNEQFNSH